MPKELTYLCDDMRHLVCVPFSVSNLHRMAKDLGIKRCWFHASLRHPHYDIPKTRVAEIRARCRVVSARELLLVVLDGTAIGAPKVEA